MSRLSKFTPEEKMNVVRRCLAGEWSSKEAGRKVGVDEKTIRRWIAQYESEGTAGLLPCRNNRVYSPKFKLQAVQDYLSGAESLITICKRYKIRSEAILFQWIQVYNAHGDFDSKKYSNGGSYMKQGRETTQEERIQIVKECLASGKNYGELALKYQVSYQQIRSWTRRFEEMGEAGLEDRRGKRKKDQTPRTELEKAQVEIQRLKHQLYLTEMERDLLKKLDEIERRDASHK